MKIQILNHNYSKVIDYPESLKKLLSYQQKEYNSRTHKYKFTHQSLIDFETDTILTGFVGLIKDTYPNVIIEDYRIFPDFEYQEPKLSVTLRDYQVDYLIEGLRQKRLIIDSITGSGKTAILAALLDCFHLPTLIIAPNLTILAQLQTELSKLLPKCKFGVCGGGKMETGHNVILGVVNSLIKLTKEELNRFDVVLMDEVHKSPASQCQEVILKTNAAFRYGFSGSPEGRSDGRDLVSIGLFGKIVKLVNREQLVKDGYLARSNIEVHRGWWEGEYHNLEDLLIVNNKKRNELICNIVKNNKKSTILILVKRIEHGVIIHNMLPGSIFVHGETELEKREEIREKVKKGEFKILIASDVFATGMDIPNIEVGIDARGSASSIMTLQGMGRVGREWMGVCKKWIDIYDTWTPILEDHSLKRLMIYKENELHIDFVGFPPGMEKKLNEL